MTNTYPDDASLDVKTFEELRCVRCVLERLLTSLDPAGFKDYQLEKFSGSAEARALSRTYLKEAVSSIDETMAAVDKLIEEDHKDAENKTRV
jgi:hypothetical protein